MEGDARIENDSFVSVTNDSVAHSKYWVAAFVQMNTEKRVGSQLNKLGIINYVPTQSEIHQWSDRKKKLERVAIPMVVFILTDEAMEKRLRTFSFIYKLISYPGQKAAARIPEEQIEKLKFMLGSSDVKVEVSESVYEIGDEVEIVRGPLKGLVGELCYVEKSRPMVGIYLELLGYVCVNVNRNDIKSNTK